MAATNGYQNDRDYGRSRNIKILSRYAGNVD